MNYAAEIQESEDLERVDFELACFFSTTSVRGSSRNLALPSVGNQAARLSTTRIDSSLDTRLPTATSDSSVPADGMASPAAVSSTINSSSQITASTFPRRRHVPPMTAASHASTAEARPSSTVVTSQTLDVASTTTGIQESSLRGPSSSRSTLPDQDHRRVPALLARMSDVGQPPRNSQRYHPDGSKKTRRAKRGGRDSSQ